MLFDHPRRLRNSTNGTNGPAQEAIRADPQLLGSRGTSTKCSNLACDVTVHWINFRFRLSTNDLFSPPTPKHSYFLSSTPVPTTPYNFITTPYALNVLLKFLKGRWFAPKFANGKRIGHYLMSFSPLLILKKPSLKWNYTDLGETLQSSGKREVA
jgi:hypothetical protein